MDFESRIIAGFKNKFIGDDGAIVDGNVVVSKDLFVENSHFKVGWLNFEQIAYKSMIVNISDAISMNAIPKWVLLGLSLPSWIKPSDVTLLRRGFTRACNEYGCVIVGGDTVKSNELSISITVISKISKGQKPLLRSGLKAGDIFAFTGDLGSSIAGLKAFLNGGKPRAKSRFIYPVLRDKFIYNASKYLRCGMDISDGLSKDLSRILSLNNLGVNFKRKLQKNQLKSGEEYEMLIAYSPRNFAKIKNLARKFRIKLTPFARAVRGKYRHNGKAEHF